MGDTDNRRVTTTIGRLKNPLLPDIFYPIFFIRYFLSDIFYPIVMQYYMKIPSLITINQK
jgi:hypothetical protein